MSGREQAFGVGFCIFAILCILHRELITFVPFYVLPLGFFSFLSLIFFAIPTDDEGTIDYKDAAIRMFVAGSIAVLLLLTFGEREYDKQGNIIRIQASQELNESYNSWTKPLVMGVAVFRPTVYEPSPYDGATLLKFIAFALVFGGPMMSYAMVGWHLPRQREKEEKRIEEASPGSKENLKGEIRRHEWMYSNLEKELSKKDVEIQALRAENRSLKKKLGDS